MRNLLSRTLAVIALIVSSATVAVAQQALDKLEGILDAEAAAEPAPKAPTPAEPTPAAPTPAKPKEFRPGYLGLYAIEIDGKLIVETVRADSPAEAAKIRAGDEIVRIGAAQPATLEEMTDALAPLAAGARVPFIVRRGGRELSLVAVLGERPARLASAKPQPEPTPADPSSDALGALGELESLLDDEPPADESPTGEKAVPAGESIVLKRVATLEAELKLLNSRIGVLERTLDRVERATEE